MLLRASEAELRALGGRKEDSILAPLLSGKGSTSMTLFVPVNAAFDSSPAVDLIDDETLLAVIPFYAVHNSLILFPVHRKPLSFFNVFFTKLIDLG